MDKGFILNHKRNMYTEKSNQIKKKKFHIYFLTSSTIPIILCALLDYSFTCNVISICVEQCIFKQLFPNVYYITATKQHNAAPPIADIYPGSNTLIDILIISGYLCMHAPWHIFYKDSWGFHWKLYLNHYSEDLTRKFLQVLHSIWNLDLKRNNDLFNTSPS